MSVYEIRLAVTLFGRTFFSKWMSYDKYISKCDLISKLGIKAIWFQVRVHWPM